MSSVFLLNFLMKNRRIVCFHKPFREKAIFTNLCMSFVCSISLVFIRWKSDIDLNSQRKITKTGWNKSWTRNVLLSRRSTSNNSSWTYKSSSIPCYQTSDEYLHKVKCKESKILCWLYWIVPLITLFLLTFRTLVRHIL